MLARGITFSWVHYDSYAVDCWTPLSPIHQYLFVIDLRRYNELLKSMWFFGGHVRKYCSACCVRVALMAPASRHTTRILVMDLLSTPGSMWWMTPQTWILRFHGARNVFRLSTYKAKSGKLVEVEWRMTVFKSKDLPGSGPHNNVYLSQQGLSAPVEVALLLSSSFTINSA